MNRTPQTTPSADSTRNLAARRVLVSAASALFVNFVVVNGLTPLYPSIARDLGMGIDSFSAFIALQGAINVLLQIPVGIVADRVGRRPVMTIGMGFMFTASVLRWQTHNPAVFAVSQVLIGISGPCVVSASFAVVADAYDAGRAQAIGILQVGIGLGQGAGYVLAGFLGPLLGWREFSAVIGVLPLALIPFTLRLREERFGAQEALRTSIVAALRFLVVPAVAIVTIVNALDFASYAGATYLLPFIAHERGLSTTATGLLLLPILVGTITGPPVAGRWADHAGIGVPVFVSVAIVVVATGAFGLVGFSPVVAVLCYYVIGVGVSSTIGLTAAAVADLAQRRRVGTGAALGGLRIGQGLGPAIGPAVAGLLFVHGGQAVAYLGLAAGLAVAAGLTFAVPELWTRRSESAAQP